MNSVVQIKWRRRTDERTGKQSEGKMGRRRDVWIKFSYGYLVIEQCAFHNFGTRGRC